MVWFKITRKLECLYEEQRRGRQLLLKPSALTLVEAKSFLRVDYDLDDFLIEMMLEAAKGYVQTYTKRSLEELDEYPLIQLKSTIQLVNF